MVLRLFHKAQTSTLPRAPWRKLETLGITASDGLPGHPWGLRDTMEWQRKWNRMGTWTDKLLCCWNGREVEAVSPACTSLDQWQDQAHSKLNCKPGARTEPYAQSRGLVGKFPCQHTSPHSTPPGSSPQSLSPSSHYPSSDSCLRKKGHHARTSGNQKRSAWNLHRGIGRKIAKKTERIHGRRNISQSRRKYEQTSTWNKKIQKTFLLWNKRSDTTQKEIW